MPLTTRCPATPGRARTREEGCADVQGHAQARGALAPRLTHTRPLPLAGARRRAAHRQQLAGGAPHCGHGGSLRLHACGCMHCLAAGTALHRRNVLAVCAAATPVHCTGDRSQQMQLNATLRITVQVVKSSCTAPVRMSAHACAMTAMRNACLRRLTRFPAFTSTCASM